LRNAIPLDRETIDKYRLIIEARDSGEPSLLDICFVEVSVLDENDNPPRFSKLLNVKISEGTNIGDVVFKVGGHHLFKGEFKPWPGRNFFKN
jgi:hypothetical protein